MAVYDHQEREQLDDLKAWWAQWGAYVVAAVSAVAVVFLAVTLWRYWQDHRSAAAYTLYFTVSDAVDAKNPDKAQAAMNQLTSDFASNGYTPRAGLLMAKALWDAGKPVEAQKQLRWVIDHAGEASLKDIARYRLAETLVEERKFDEALGLLVVKHAAPFDMLYSDLRGDALMGAGRASEAITAYQTALTQLAQAGSPYRVIIQTKLDAAIAAAATPVAAATPAAPPTEAAPAAATPAPTETPR